MVAAPVKGNEYLWQSAKYGQVHVCILEDHAASPIEAEIMGLPIQGADGQTIQYWFIEIETVPYCGHQAYAPVTELF